MEQPPADFHSQDAGENEVQPKVNSDFYINRHNSSFGCNSLSSLSAGYTTNEQICWRKIVGLEISRDENDDGLEVDVESFHSVPVHLIHPDSESNNTEDRSSMSSLTNELTPSLSKNNKSSLFSKHLRQIQRSSRAQFLVEGIADAFDAQDQTSNVYCPRNGVYPWYSAQPNQFDPNNNHSSDKNTPPSQHEVSMSTYEKDFITSQEHINKLVRSPPGLSAHHNTPQLALNNSPQTTRQSGNSFLTYVYGRYSDCPRKKRIALLLFLIALFGGCIGLIVVTAGGKKDNLPANTNEKLVGLEDVAYEGGQLSLQEALPEGFSDEEAYLRDGSDGMNNTDSLSNTPSSSPSTKEPATSKPSPSPTTLAPLRQPSLAPTPVSTPLPSQRPDKPPPSGFPTQKPSRQPSQSPTSKPSRRPSQQPSMKPTRRPTPRPTPRPTLITLRPSTETPTRRPTNMPSPKPSSPPSKEPSKSPTQKPTTLAPSKTPTPEPSTAAPSVEPTSPPSAVPTNPPTTSTTDLPTTLPPSSSSSLSPTWPKSLSPSVTPTVKPTTTAPSSSPTVQPVTSEPSRSPTSNPVTLEPSSAPSSPPTSSPLTTPPSKAPTPDPSTLVPPTMTMLTPTAAPTKVTTPSLVPNHTNEPTATASITSTHTLFPTYAPTVA